MFANASSPLDASTNNASKADERKMHENSIILMNVKYA